MRLSALLFLSGMICACTPLQAASVCSGSVTFENADGCLDNVFNRTNIAGLDAKPSGDSYFLWLGDDVVVARCIRPGETQVVLFAYHQQKDRACPLLNRVRDALQKAP